MQRERVYPSLAKMGKLVFGNAKTHLAILLPAPISDHTFDYVNLRLMSSTIRVKSAVFCWVEG